MRGESTLLADIVREPMRFSRPARILCTARAFGATAGSRATGSCQSSQVRKEAAPRGFSRVPRSRLVVAPNVRAGRR